MLLSLLSHKLIYIHSLNSLYQVRTMASIARPIADEVEPYETLFVQIKFIGVNLAKYTSSGKILRYGGWEIKLSRFGTWVFDADDKQEDVNKILNGGGSVVAFVWALAKAYSQITVWVTDVEGHCFALDVKRSNRALVLDEIGKGTMGQKLQRVLKNLTVTDAYKNIKIKLVKILRDSSPTKQKKVEDSTSPIPEMMRLEKLEEAERIASFMHDGNFSWAFMKLKTLLQNETNDTVRLQMLIRLAICCCHVENDGELESACIKMKKLMETVVIPEIQFHIYDQEFKALVDTLILNQSFIKAVEIVISWIEVAKKISDMDFRMELISVFICLACNSIDKLISLKPGAFLKSQILQYVKQMEKITEYMKGANDCDALAKARFLYHTAFVLHTVKIKVENKDKLIFGKETKEFHNAAGYWADFIFVASALCEDPRTAMFYTTDDTFLRNIRQISENPNLLKEKISDPKIAIANEVLLSKAKKIDSTASHTSEGEHLDQVFFSGMFGKSEARSKPKTSGKVTKSQEAEKEKEKGNDAYKKKEFEKAIQHYDKAILLDPQNAMFHSNKAAVYIEQQKYEPARASCLTAVNIAQNSDRHTPKEIAKILARLGRTEMLDNRFGKAVQVYERSLNLHYDAKVQEQLDECKHTLRLLMMTMSMRQQSFFPFGF